MIPTIRDIDLTAEHHDVIHTAHRVMTSLEYEAEKARSIRNDALQSMIRQYGFARAFAILTEKYGPIEGLSKSNIKRIQGPKESS